MAKEIKKENNKYYQCSECKLYYLDKSWAKKCEAWCPKHNSCNLDIIKHSVKKP